jgi:hypothetical protein
MAALAIVATRPGRAQCEIASDDDTDRSLRIVAKGHDGAGRRPSDFKSGPILGVSRCDGQRSDQTGDCDDAKHDILLRCEHCLHYRRSMRNEIISDYIAAA